MDKPNVAHESLSPNAAEAAEYVAGYIRDLLAVLDDEHISAKKVAYILESAVAGAVSQQEIGNRFGLSTGDRSRWASWLGARGWKNGRGVLVPGINWFAVEPSPEDARDNVISLKHKGKVHLEKLAL